MAHLHYTAPEPSQVQGKVAQKDLQRSYDHSGQPREQSGSMAAAVSESHVHTQSLQHRVEALEVSLLGAAMSGGLVARVQELERAGLGVEQGGALPARVQAMEDAGLV